MNYEYKPSEMKTLFDLGLLTDDDNWALFLEQEKRYEIDEEARIKYVNYRQAPIKKTR